MMIYMQGTHGGIRLADDRLPFNYVANGLPLVIEGVVSRARLNYYEWVTWLQNDFNFVVMWRFLKRLHGY